MDFKFMSSSGELCGPWWCVVWEMLQLAWESAGLLGPPDSPSPKAEDLGSINQGSPEPASPNPQGQSLRTGRLPGVGDVLGVERRQGAPGSRTDTFRDQGPGTSLSLVSNRTLEY